MNIKISNEKAPIYKQIKEQIKNDIASNKINEKTKVPSIRNLANELDVSVMTVKKAYDELLEEGFIITVQGKGSYVNKKAIKKIRKEKIAKIEKLLEEAIDIVKSLNITKEELLTHYLKLEDKKEISND